MVQRSQDKFAKQEAILRAIERLEQRDTQHAAASDLCKLIRVGCLSAHRNGLGP